MNIKLQTASWIGQIRSRARQPLRGEPAVRLPLGGFHLEKILIYQDMHNFWFQKKYNFLCINIHTFWSSLQANENQNMLYGTKPISLWPSCLFIILIIMGNFFMLLILTVINVLTGPTGNLSSFIMVNISIMLVFIYLSHQACGRRKPDPSFCHSQHNPIKEVFLVWWVCRCHLTQRASFTAHWWRTPSLLHEGIWNMGCFWLAGSWIYLRRPHAFMIHLLRYFRISRFCVIYQISAVQLRSCLSNFYFQCLPEENIFKDPATWNLF